MHRSPRIHGMDDSIWVEDPVSALNVTNLRTHEDNSSRSREPRGKFLRHLPRVKGWNALQPVYTDFMASTFAVIDAGSNAIRMQIASVDQPGIYRIIEQDRKPARL